MLRATLVSVFMGSVLVTGTALASPDPQAEQARVVRPEVPDLATAKPFDPAGWTKLGQLVLTGRDTSATVKLKVPKAAIDQLALVADGELDLSSVTVGASGSRVMRGAQHHFWASAPFKQIDLPRADKRLRTVTVMYKLPKAAAVTLTVYGRDKATASASTTSIKADEASAQMIDLGNEAPAAETGISTRAGWTLLGTQTVDGSHDSDVIKVGGETQAFDRLALVVTGGDLELHALKLRFDGGTTADLGTQYYFRGDARSRILTLPAGAIVKLVQLKYGSDRGHGKTKVEVWAR